MAKIIPIYRPVRATPAALKRLLKEAYAERDAARRDAALNARIAEVAAKWLPRGSNKGNPLPLDERVFAAGVVTMLAMATLPPRILNIFEASLVEALPRFRAGELESIVGFSVGDDDDEQPEPVSAGGGK